MQFHLNGFRPGDPSVAEPARHPDDASRSAGVDVLVVGCGPAGLTLAAQLSAFPDIVTRIVEQKPGPLSLGQADGIACRTMEMFEALGFSERVLKEAYWVNETSFWKPDARVRENIARSGRIQDVEDDLSEMPHVILNQARVHDFLLDVMRNSPSRLVPDYACRLLDVKNDPATSANHPVVATLERLDPSRQGEIETVRARFVVGCDGARSAVRRSLGRPLRGEQANQAWGVMDVLAVTDFPDVRLKAMIQSANEGNAVLIPREGGYLFRLYIELDKLNANERVSERTITADDLIAAARRILRPYTLEVKEIAWWSVYEIGQRLCDRFDDVEEGEQANRFPRAFIAGDACHTHSPKAGQGMNVSLADGFNLGWKLAGVLRQHYAPRILHTYTDERRSLAKELIDFDRELVAMFGAPPKDPDDPDSQGVDPAEFQKYFVKQGRFTAGTAVHYAPSAIIAEPRYQHLATKLVIGMRFHSAPVIRLADARQVQLAHTVKADGRWRLFAFAADEDPASSASRLRSLCEFLAASERSPVMKFTPPEADIDSVIDVRAVLQQGFREVALDAMPAFLLPQTGRYRLRDYEKIFCADLRGGRDIFDMRGIDRASGCVVIVRPDQFVAHVLPLEAHAEVSDFFDGFMLPARGRP